MLFKRNPRVIARLAAACALAGAGVASGGQVSMDSSFGHAAGAVAGPGGLYLLTPAMGKQAGGNLFFSLGQFNLDRGDVARFSGSASVANVFTRVTGGASSIDGTIQNTIPNAGFYLINPAGVVFGPDARLNVQGSFAVTTANLVKLADGSTFGAPGAADAALTTAAPAAFGFLSNAPASIKIVGSTLAVPSGRSLTIAGGGVTIRSGHIAAPSGIIAMASVASAGAATLVDSTPGVASFAALGPVHLNGAHINADGAGGGKIILRGGATVMNQTTIRANTLAGLDGRGIAINLRGDLTSINSGIASQTFSSGRAGDIDISAADISAAGATASGLSTAIANVFGAGPGGNINVQTGNLSLVDGAQFSASTGGTGNGGKVAVNATGNVTLDGQLSGRLTGILAQTARLGVGSGRGGDLSVTAGSLSIMDGASIDASTFGSGDGGSVAVSVARQTMLDAHGSGLFTAISAQSNLQSPGGGKGGDIHLATGTLHLARGAVIDASTFGTGDGGDVMLSVTGLATLNSRNATNFTTISAESQSTAPGAGIGGDVRMSAGALQVFDGAQITTTTLGTGAGGNVTVTVAGQMTLSSGDPNALTGVFAQSTMNAPGGGNSGNAQVTAGSLKVLAGAEIASNTFGTGAGGNVTVSVAGAAVIDPQGLHTFTAIASQSESTAPNAGAGGSVIVTADSLAVLNGGKIDASTFGPGAGGGLNVTVAGLLNLNDKDDRSFDTGIRSNSFLTTPGGGAAGDINVTAGTLQVLNGATIPSDTVGTGPGGNIVVTVKGAALFNGRRVSSGNTGIFADTTSPASNAGRGGSIQLNAGSVNIIDALLEASTQGLGNGGDVRLSVSGSALFDGRGDVNSGMDADAIPNNGSFGGSGGAVHVNVGGDLTLLAGSTITADTQDESSNGNVHVNAGGLLTINGMTTPGFGTGISADSLLQSRFAGNAGRVTVHAANLIALNGAFIESFTQAGGQAGDVTVRIDGQASLSHGAEIDSDTSGGGNAGRVTVNVGGTLSLDRQQATRFTGISSGSFRSGAGGGAAGVMSISAGSLNMSGASILTNTFGTGAGGQVQVNVSGVATLQGEDGSVSNIGSSSLSHSPGAGAAGDVIVNAGRFVGTGGGEILATTFGPGLGGNIHLSAADIFFDGMTNPANTGVFAETAGNLGVLGGSIDVTGSHSLTLSGGALISTASGGTGKAGDILVLARSMTVLTQAIIRSNAFSSGDAGQIQIDVSGLATFASGGFATVSALQSQGGGVTLNTGALAMDDSGISASAGGAGGGGDITVNSVNSIQLTGGAGFSATSTGSGKGGDILVHAGSLFFDDSGLAAAASGTGRAGSVRIQSDNAIRLQNGSELEVSSQTANGGVVQIDAGGDIDLFNSQISARAGHNGGSVGLTTPGLLIVRNTQIIALAENNGGSITIDPSVVVLDHSRLSAHANTGHGGMINIIDSHGLLDFDTVTNVSSTFGMQGTLTIQTPDQDVAASLIALPATLLSHTLSLEPTCTQAAGDQTSSFITTGRGGLAPQPGGWVIPPFIQERKRKP